MNGSESANVYFIVLVYFGNEPDWYVLPMPFFTPIYVSALSSAVEGLKQPIFTVIRKVLNDFTTKTQTVLTTPSL